MKDFQKQEEERFDREVFMTDYCGELDEPMFSASVFCGCMEGDMYDHYPEGMKKVKSFLKEHDQRLIEHIVEMAEGMKMVCKYHLANKRNKKCPSHCAYTGKDNKALTDLIAKLKEEVWKN